MGADFEIFRSKQNRDHYVAVMLGDLSHNAEGVRQSPNLEVYTNIADDGTHHLGFDPVAAKAAIRDHGFYALAVLVEERDGLQEIGL